MTEHKTFPGKVYTVSCAEDTTVVLPDPLGVKEAVVLECTAGQQLHVTATAGRLETSSDQAIVTELFKLAPRLRLALLQGGAGGWLPKGFTELEWLESSGTQHIDTGIVTDGTYTIGIKVTPTSEVYQFWCGRSDCWNAGTVPEEYGDSMVYYQGLTSSNSHGGTPYTYARRRYRLNKSLYQNYDPLATADIVWVEGSDKITYNGLTTAMMKYTSSTINTNNVFNKTYWLFKVNSSRLPFDGCIIHKFRMQNANGDYVFNGVPVLDAEGIPCMYDKVSKTCFYNVGSGTFGYRVLHQETEFAPMSLRDPYYTAPSGVYARLSGENELEVLADTEETSGNGWEWFANTAEAYKHFGIVPEMEEDLLTE